MNALASDHTNGMLITKIKNTQFGIDVGQIRDIVNETRIYPLPGAHPCIPGMVMVRGEPLTLIDLNCVLTGQNNPKTKGRFIIVFERFSPETHELLSTQALLVDQVLDFSQLDPERTQPPTDLNATPFIKGQAIIDTEIINLPHLDKIVDYVTGKEA